MEEKTAPAPAVPEVPPPPTPADRLKAAIDTLNKSIGADIHDRLHAQGNAIQAIADVLFSTGGTSGQG